MKFDISAHRGDSHYWIENTLAAFDSAIKKRATSIEFDVLLTKDQVPVIHHDLMVRPNNFTNLKSTKEVKDLTVLEITELRYRKRKLDRGTSQISTLKDLFSFLSSHSDPHVKKMIFHLELKSGKVKGHSAALVVEKILREINDSFIRERTVIRSFDWLALEALKLNAPDIPRVVLVERWWDPTYWKVIFSKPEKFARKYEPILMAPHFTMVTERFIKTWKDLGVGVNPYTVNDPNLAKTLFDQGAQGVTTDNPALIQHSLKLE